MSADVSEIYNAALDAMLDDLAEERAKFEKQSVAAKASEQRVRELRDALNALSHQVSPARKSEIRKKLTKILPVSAIRPEAGRDSYRDALNVLMADPATHWTVEALQRTLQGKGFDEGSKYLHNVIQRLLRHNLLIKVRRGVYQINGMNLGLIRQEDFEDGE